VSEELIVLQLVSLIVILVIRLPYILPFGATRVRKGKEYRREQNRTENEDEDLENA
jgi:hypothetical protein